MARNPYRLYQIKEANAELVKQDEELAALRPLKEENEKLKKESSALDSIVSEATSQLQTDLKAAQAQVATLTGEKAALTSENATLKATAATFAAKEAGMAKEIEEKASARALEIVAKTGTPLPLATTPNANPASTPKPTTAMTGFAALVEMTKAQLNQK